MRVRFRNTGHSGCERYCTRPCRRQTQEQLSHLPSSASRSDCGQAPRVRNARRTSSYQRSLPRRIFSGTPNIGTTPLLGQRVLLQLKVHVPSRSPPPLRIPAEATLVFPALLTRCGWVMRGLWCWVWPPIAGPVSRRQSLSALARGRRRWFSAAGTRRALHDRAQHRAMSELCEDAVSGMGRTRAWGDDVARIEPLAGGVANTCGACAQRAPSGRSLRARSDA